MNENVVLSSNGSKRFVFVSAVGHRQQNISQPFDNHS